MSVLIPFSIELLSKSTFEAPNFILVFGLTYRSRSIRSGAVERIFLAHLVWFGFIFLCFCFWFGDLWFCGCGEDAPEGRKLILQREGRKMAAVTASLCVSPQLTTVRRPGSGPTCSSCSSSAHSSPPAAARVNCTSTPFLASSGWLFLFLLFLVFFTSAFSLGVCLLWLFCGWVGGEWPMVGKLKIERANPQSYLRSNANAL